MSNKLVMKLMKLFSRTAFSYLSTLASQRPWRSILNIFRKNAFEKLKTMSEEKNTSSLFPLQNVI